jgi:hypothetical protein
VLTFRSVLGSHEVVVVGVYICTRNVYISR